MVILTVLLPVIIAPDNKTITVLEHKIGSEEMPQVGHYIELPNVEGVITTRVRSITHKMDRTTQIVTSRIRTTQEKVADLVAKTSWKVWKSDIPMAVQHNY